MDYLTIRPIENYTLLDGFCDESGELNPEIPRSKWNVTFTDSAKQTLVVTVVAYESSDSLQQVIDMGMKEGLISTLERLDELILTLS
jgi:TolB-like protein